MCALNPGQKLAKIIGPSPESQSILKKKNSNEASDQPFKVNEHFKILKAFPSLEFLISDIKKSNKPEIGPNNSTVSTMIT